MERRMAVVALVVAWTLVAVGMSAAAPRRLTREEREAHRLDGSRVKSWGDFWQYWPTLLGFSETKVGVGVDVTYVRQHGYVDDRFSVSAGPLRMDDPTDYMKFDFLTFQAERRFYVRDRLYWNLTVGCNRFDPRSAMRRYFLDRGEQLDSSYEPFARIGLGWYTGKIKLFRNRYPLVLKVRYTAAQPWDFPSPLPGGGPDEIDPGGFSASFGLRYRF